ncbi:MAG TPA: A/G-specific adenine glycosylase, partial [Candidatus Bathyarchaeia archaeon]|nr:A/G-specific adenine glycosylase [Candidatus Bathyarchaeia archaeon]
MYARLTSSATLRRRVLSWYRRSGRDLPWRHTSEPYRVLVSEMMLQQTQVSRVLPAYRRFLQRFPTLRALSRAPLGDVLREWSGLGYNRRAVALHAAARAMGDRVPDDLDALLALPGIGPYTARAVLTFGFERAVTPLDVNTARPLVRAFGARSQTDADRLVPDGRAWDWNQALMDLGATVCTRREPDCDACPLAPR